MIILKGYKSLVFYSSSVLIVTKKNTVYSYDIENKKITKLFSIPISIKDTILFSTNISIRILRLGVANATIYKNHLFFTYTKKIWIAKLDESEIIPQIIFEFENGKSPLNFSLVEENQSTYFNAGIYFGEYFSNPSESPVQIYHIHPNTFEVKPVFTFPEKTINHIHNLVFDDSERYFWVLAGDFGHCAGIWKAQNFFKDVECICNGKQAYRSCVGFTHQNDFLFATDSQFETNSIQLLKQENDKIFFEKKIEINGPCIFGTKYQSWYIFTTATEPQVEANVRLVDIVKRKKAPAIKVNQSEIVLLKPDLSAVCIYNNPKDFWPYYLCNLGNIYVTSKQHLSPYLATYNIANTKNNMCTEIRSLQEIEELITLNT